MMNVHDLLHAGRPMLMGWVYATREANRVVAYMAIEQSHDS